MKYAYYPGCSLTTSAREYDQTTQALLKLLDSGVQEIPDWTCCGASVAPAVSGLLSLALPARNLALAEKELPGLDVLVPCSACYLNLYRAADAAARDKATRARLNEVLAEEGLAMTAGVRVRHLLDVLANDFGASAVTERLRRSLEGLVIAPYYGCQALRPYTVFDDPERPKSMDGLINATGAKVHHWDKGAACCGASLMVTEQAAALRDVARIIEAAQGADAIVTVCPLCEMNLGAFQDRALKYFGHGKPVSVLYLPQLIGLALGMSEEEALLKKNMAVTPELLAKLAQTAKPVPA
jgi:heterodisulfide reductase subunit B